MKNPITVGDAISLLNRTSLPSVITEGSDDYRIMRRLEERLSDLGVDFIPLGGKSKVLDVWKGIDPNAKRKCLGVVDLDLWLLSEIPVEYQCDSLIFTMGYSIENDLYADSNVVDLLDSGEKSTFLAEIDTISAWHAKEIGKAISGSDYRISDHANKILTYGDISSTLDADELALRRVLQFKFGQVLRGKTLFELLARQLNKPDRYAKFGYKQIYEMASANTGDIFKEMELRIRSYFV